MIIVSQDRSTIVNWDNVEYIRVLNRCIRCDFAGSFVLLGNYETEERAKEVLNDLLDEAKDAYFWSELPKR